MTEPQAEFAATVLVVDNEPAIRGLIARLLAARGCTVLQAHSGEEAIVLAREHQGPIQLLVTDVMMPGINGFDLAESLAGSRPEIRVLFISGHVDDSPVARHGLEDHAANFLVKPFTGEAFIRKVKEILSPLTRGRLPHQNPA